MRLDELITQTTIHENTKVMVDRRVTTASRTALGCCAAATAVFNRTRADDATDIPGFIVDWFGFPTAGFGYTCATLAIGAVLCLVTKGFTAANEREHKAIVVFAVAAAITAVPIIAAVVVWMLFIMAIIAMFAAMIGFALLVLWALLQAN